MREICQVNYYKANTPLLSPGDIQNRLYFIKEGVIRIYSSNEEYEWTSWFFAKGDFALIPDSFIFNKKSTDYLETCCDTIVVSIPKQDYLQFINDFNEVKKVEQHVSQLLLQRGKQHIHSLSFLSASARYARFSSEHPYICRNVKSKHLASYLGTNPESVSRFRKQQST